MSQSIALVSAVTDEEIRGAVCESDLPKAKDWYIIQKLLAWITPRLPSTLPRLFASHMLPIPFAPCVLWTYTTCLWCRGVWRRVLTQARLGVLVGSGGSARAAACTSIARSALACVLRPRPPTAAVCVTMTVAVVLVRGVTAAPRGNVRVQAPDAAVCASCRRRLQRVRGPRRRRLRCPSRGAVPATRRPYRCVITYHVCLLLRVSVLCRCGSTPGGCLFSLATRW